MRPAKNESIFTASYPSAGREQPLSPDLARGAGAEPPPVQKGKRTLPTTLLFVDDNLALVEVTTRYISELRPQWRILLAHTLAEGRRIYDQCFPDAAVLDMGLPDGSGLDLLIEFKRHRPELPIVVISGDDNEALRQKVADRWGSAFLAKPFSAPALVNQVEWLMYTARRQSRGQIASPEIDAVLTNPHALALRSDDQTLAVPDPEAARPSRLFLK